LGVWLDRIDKIASTATRTYKVLRGPVVGLLGLVTKALTSSSPADAKDDDDGPDIIEA
jgi:hypothetical protein